MLKKDQYTKQKWAPNNKRHFEDHGYNFTAYKDEFVIRVKDLFSSSKEKVKVVCDNCGKEYEMTYESYCVSIKQKGLTLCRKCARIRSAKDQTERTKDKMYDAFIQYCDANGYEPVSKREEITGYKFRFIFNYGVYKNQEITYSGIAKPNVKQTLLSKTASLYPKALEIAKEKHYTILTPPEDIVCNKSRIKYSCEKHGIHEMRIANMISGKGCPDCAKEYSSKFFSLDINEAIKRVEELGGKLLNPEDYINNNERNLRIICPKCGNEFTTSLVLFTQRDGQLCKDCFNTESTGEVRIRKWLEANDVKYEQEKWFPDCRDQRPLRFDFYLPMLNTCIEFDGSQHYRYNKGFSNLHSAAANGRWCGDQRPPCGLKTAG